ncbi:MAG: hypothetical protein IPH84_14215 [Bacteroidales bacterium]|nr:hypothetical protein [Bacteroidales bacterium]
MNQTPATDKHPPSKSNGIWGDLRYFFIQNPAESTLVKFSNEEKRREYSSSILQRTGMEVDKFRVLNIHKIGIDVPATFVFEELLKWNGDSSCWPNHIARVTLKDGELKTIKVNLFGLPSDPFRPGKGLLRIQLLHLFNLNAIKIQRTPEPYDFDNARYLLYECCGGYPIGVFSMYLRSAIPERGEKEVSQLFILVGFNFYGSRSLTRVNFIHKTWEAIHNRATAHILNRFKQLCEWRFQKFITESTLKSSFTTETSDSIPF